METPKPDVKVLIAPGWLLKVEADPVSMRLVLKVGHPELQNVAAVSYDIREVAREGITVGINDMMDVAMGIKTNVPVHKR